MRKKIMTLAGFEPDELTQKSKRPFAGHSASEQQKFT
jgi:hypothetical protein